FSCQSKRSFSAEHAVAFAWLNLRAAYGPPTISIPQANVAVLGSTKRLPVHDCFCSQRSGVPVTGSSRVTHPRSFCRRRENPRPCHGRSTETTLDAGLSRASQKFCLRLRCYLSIACWIRCAAILDFRNHRT